ncbi:hypothetical protein F0262_11635 [Vibrio rotiferianus]|uniref:Uncharacterized protein n=1 Tax=Vibrio rotiferianus TaxID=190895 RepID=A0A7Y3Z8Y1_9VIBR|nr:hypothetical protein [Vibrio rotiferianus]NOH48704.1 hypothetical protein [Vibrio rotiferianus]
MAVHVRDSRLRSFVAFGNDVIAVGAQIHWATPLNQAQTTQTRHSDELKRDQESHIRALSAPVCPQS